MTILVTGVRGAVGAAVLTGLIEAGVPAEQLRASGRDPRHLVVPSGVTAVAADFADQRSLQAALSGVEQVFLLAPHGDTTPLSTALRTVGVEHAVLLSAAAVDEPDGGALGAIHQALEDAVASSGVAVTALRPGAFMPNVLGWAEEIRTSRTVSTPYPDAHHAPIHPDDLADAAVAVLTGRVNSAGVIPLTGPESLSFRDQVDILARGLDIDIELVELSPSQGRARMTTMPAAVADALLAIWAATDGIPRKTHDIAGLTGQAPRNFTEWVHQNQTAFTH